ncbi:NYN domain-containing protein [Candidatus Saccharibacteria bacterium]|nr:NYN domain-containing protein [Candidatus Saccharibacteria bacterium]
MKRVFRRKPKLKGNYAFIDSQNLNLGVQRAGWKMDWKKFRSYLKEKYNVEKAYMFIGYLPENEDLYTQMHDAGYLVALKPTLEMFSTPEKDAKEDKDKPPTKGNVDAELVMYVMKELPNYHKAIIVSGDGDFYSLIEHLLERKKLLNVMVPNWRYSTLLKPFEKYIIRLDTQKNELSYRTHFRKKKPAVKTA